MRIGIDALFYASGGSLTHLAHLLDAWFRAGELDRHEVILFGSPGSVVNLEERVQPGVMRKLQVVVLRRSGSGLLGRLFAEQVQLPRSLRKWAIDVLFCPGNVIPYAASVPTVVEFQNAAPFCESVTRRSIGLSGWLRFAMLGILMRISAVRASAVIFISEYFRDLFTTRFHFPREKGTVIYRARQPQEQRKDDGALRASLGIRGPFALSVSHLNPYKNLVELIEGFVQANRTSSKPPLQLVITGRRNYPLYYDRLRERIDTLGVATEVILAMELPHRQVQSLLAACDMYLFSSTCENCPTALIEALGAGVPIGCSNVGVMPEIAGDAVLYFDPFDPADVARAVTTLRDDSAALELRRRARERGLVFPDGQAVARRTLEVIERIRNVDRAPALVGPRWAS